MIQVKLTGAFVKLAPAENDKGAFTMEYEQDLTISGLITRLGVPGLGVKYSVLINNSRKPEDYILCDSDTVLIMPLMAGG